MADQFSLYALEDLGKTQGKRVLVRVDYNVIFSEGTIIETARVDNSIPTLRWLISQGAKIILISHNGRPDGKPDPQYSLKPIASYLAQKTGLPVSFHPDCIGAEVIDVTHSLKE